MKGRVRFAILSAALSCLLCGILGWQFFFQPFGGFGDMAASAMRNTWGVTLDFTRLAHDESVMIESAYIGCQGDDRATRFVISGEDQFIAVFECRFTWERRSWSLDTEPLIDQPVVREACPMDSGDQQGLAAFVDVLRYRPPQMSTAAVKYRVEYRRGDRIIGQEEFLVSPEFQFRSVDLHLFSRREISETYGIPEALLKRVVSPEMITERRANQALQTTPITRSVYGKTIEFGRPQRGV